MIYHSDRDPNGNTSYPAEQTLPDNSQQGLLPQSNQFDDTGRTLGVASRGFHFTGHTTENQGHDAKIHSGKSLLYDPRQNNENFIESRTGDRSNPPFKTGGDIFHTVGPVPSGVEFVPSTAEPKKQGQGGHGPSWWDRILSNQRSNTDTQSSNVGVKPPEKFQVGLRSSNVKVMKQDQNNGPGPTGISSGSVPVVTINQVSGVVGSMSS